MYSEWQRLKKDSVRYGMSISKHKFKMGTGKLIFNSYNGPYPDRAYTMEVTDVEVEVITKEHIGSMEMSQVLAQDYIVKGAFKGNAKELVVDEEEEYIDPSLIIRTVQRISNWVRRLINAMD